MAKTKIEEDKSTPSDDLLEWVNKWIHRGVKRSEIIGLLTVCAHYLEADAIKAMLEAKGKKEPIDDDANTPYNDLRHAVYWLRNEVNCRIEHGAAGTSHLMYVQG